MAFSHPASVCSEKYPVDVNVRDFVPVNLSNENYVVWKTLMLRLIEGHGLAGFINGEVSAPPERITVENDGNDETSKGGTKKIESLDYQNWERSERLLQRWIIGTINEDVLPHVVGLKSAKDMWSKLHFLRGRKFGYPYPAEINVKEFVKLTKHNYSKWEKPMLDLIKSQGLYGFINGDVPKPDQWIPVPDDGPTNYATTRIQNEDYSAWKKTDELLQHWIRETVIDLDDLYLMGSPTFSMTSKKMWHLIKRYHSKDSCDEIKEIHSSDEYLLLHKAVLTCDWDTAQKIIEGKSDAVRAFITRRKETALMIAVRCAKGNRFVKTVLLGKMLPDDLARTDAFGRTALHYAAMADNTEAAEFLVGNNSDLPNNCDDEGLSPLYLAAKYGKRKTVDYLLKVTKEEITPKVFEDINGALLIKKLILSGLYDTALFLIKRHPNVAWVQSYPALKVIASRSSSAFKSGAHLNWWQNLLYPYVPTKLKDSACHHSGGDIESPIDESQIDNCFLSAVKQNLRCVIWSLTLFVPHLKYIRKIKLKHEQALQLVKHLCNTSLEINYPKAKEVLQRSLVIAARFGIPELVEEIIAVSPDLIYHTNEMGQNIFHIAVLNRCENLFNLIYQCREEVRHIMLSSKDSTHKKCIDLVVDLKKEQKLNLRASAAGAALQMQRELQWFKEVQKRSNDYWEDNLTPEKSTFGAVYTESHEELVKEGEKWIKETAKSCTIIAALIATIVFAAVITVPGGNDCKNGLPILFEQNAFIIFVISDAFALSSSISSVLMFLAILTSRYSVTDFLYTLPNKLIIGLLSLFISILSMMIAFGATLLPHFWT